MSMRPLHADRRLVLALCLLLAMLVALTVFAPQAVAQTAGEEGGAGGSDVGANLGNLLQGYASQIYVGIIAIVSLIFLLNRRYAELGMFALAAVLVGWMVFSPDSIAGFARETAGQVLGGGTGGSGETTSGQ